MKADPQPDTVSNFAISWNQISRKQRERNIIYFWPIESLRLAAKKKSFATDSGEIFSSDNCSAQFSHRAICIFLREVFSFFMSSCSFIFRFSVPRLHDMKWFTEINWIVSSFLFLSDGADHFTHWSRCQLWLRLSSACHTTPRAYFFVVNLSSL